MVRVSPPAEALRIGQSSQALPVSRSVSAILPMSARAGSAQSVRMLPLSDGIKTRRFPIVNVSLIVANFAVWIFYELPHLQSSIFHASFYPCTVDNACHGPESWGVSWITAMFLHGSWDHILGNMLFLAIFGKNVEDAFGPLRYLAFYFAGGFAAMMTQTAMTLLFGTGAEARVPNLGASGAIAAVMGAYFVLYPNSRVLTLVLWFPIRIPAYVFLGLWFLYQLVEANFGLFSASANGGGVAFFAHVGGFIFGLIVAGVLTNAGRIAPQDSSDILRAPA
jgi:membrane associated rhomboid family serine protease